MMKRSSQLLVLLVISILAGCASIASYRSASVPETRLSEHAASAVLRTDYLGRVEKAIEQAGDNRYELHQVLDHYWDMGEPLKYKAAEFLIANMPSHGYQKISIINTNGTEIPFDALQFESFEAAQAAMDALERENPGARTKVDSVPDLQAIKADQMIADIDLAFATWQARPWARDVAFDVFCNYILPYRGSSEPINPWRAACIEEINRRFQRVGGLDQRALRMLFYEIRESWVKFETKAYMHPTDQSFEEMRQSRVGRCEDLSNMFIYISRSAGVPATSDYTPAWPKGDNNHNWEVILDGNGKVIDRPNFSHIAKVYRKMFAEQEDLPIFHCMEGETVPPWLAGRCTLDVTREYKPDAPDITINLTEPIPERCSWAYLAVFNSNDWVPLAAGRIDRESRSATFPAVGTDIMYRPVYCVAGDAKKHELKSAAPILIIEKDGTSRMLDQPIDKNGSLETVEILQTKDVQINADTGKPENIVQVEPGKEYELFYFEKDWTSLGRKNSTGETLVYDNLPPGWLYRLCEVGGKGAERPFTVEHGKPVLW